MNNKLIIGIDLSFNSTGLTITELENNSGKKIEFHRLVFETKPSKIKNVNQHTYNLPINISANDIVKDETDFYSEDQANITLKAMVCCKRILKIITDKLNKINQKPIDFYVNIEGFIMPQVQGSVQFRSLSGLIMLQGILRNDLIKLKLNENSNIEDFKIFITSPTDLKSWFSLNGSADKQVMLDSFLNFYDGVKLLPDTNSLGKINDVIDSFALMMNCLTKVYGIKIESKTNTKILNKHLKKQKTKKIKQEKRNI